MAKVEIKDLTKRFGKVDAVSDLSLSIGDGEFVVLLGPSGCGKTTTLRCIAGLETPEKGEILIDGKIVNDLDPSDRDISMVFQNYALYPHMSVQQNLAFPLINRKMARREVEKKVRDVSQLLKISHLLDRKPKQLSGGEAQRVALGRAIVREPKAFLMDEPLSNLDAKLRMYTRVELKKLQVELGVTTIYVTHDQTEAMTMASKVALMDLGRLQQVATPDDLYVRPSNQFVAGFIGSPPMNFIECTLCEADGRGYLDAGAFKVALDEDVFRILKNRAKSSDLVLGLRPEDLSIDFQADKGSTALPGEIYLVEPLGTETIVDVKVGDAVVKVKERSTYRAKIADKVHVMFDRRHLHIFDGKTAETLV